LPFHCTLEKHSRNQKAIDFIRSFKDSIDSRIPVHGLHGITARKPVSSVDLNCFVRAVIEDFGTGDFEDRAFNCVFLDRAEHQSRYSLVDRGFAIFNHSCCAIHGTLTCINACLHLCKLVLDRTKTADRRPELTSFTRIGCCKAQNTFGPANRSRAKLDPAKVQDVKCDDVTTTDLAKQPVLRDFAVSKQDWRRGRSALAHLVLLST